MDSWKWFGNAGHLCVSNQCKFHLTTLIGKYIISTVGEYVPEGKCMSSQDFDTIGHGRKYETMVFLWKGEVCECGCGLPIPENYTEIDVQGYNTPKHANYGHLDMCKKYARIS